MERKSYAKYYVIGTAILIFIVLFLALGPIVMIRAGQRGVVLRWGAVQEEILNEGIHFIIPIKTSVQKMDVTIQKLEAEVGAGSKDLQVVTATIATNWAYQPSAVNWIYQNFRHDVDIRKIEPTIEESLKAITARYTAEELITKRDKVKEDLAGLIKESLKNSRINVEAVFMTNFKFSDEFDAAIERKVTAEQKALEAKNVLEQKKYEAEQIKVSAQAEAEKIKIQAQAVNAQGGKDYVALKAIEKWDGKLPVQMIPGSSVPFLNLKKE